MNKIYESIKDNLNKDIPDFKSGDTVAVGVKVIEGNRSRVQTFEGVVISISSGSNISKTFTVRKISNNVGVERIFPIYSPNIDSIKVLKKGKVRRAKLYYLRDRTGKSARIAEKIRKNIGIDIETVPEQATPENIVQEKKETKPQETIKETSEKKVNVPKEAPKTEEKKIDKIKTLEEKK